MLIEKIINNIGFNILKINLSLSTDISFFLNKNKGNKQRLITIGISSYKGSILKSGKKNLYESKKDIYTKINTLLLKVARDNKIVN